MNWFRTIAPVIAVAAICCNRCAAQSMMSMTRGMSAVTILMVKEVQKELKLRPDQVKRIQEKQKELGGAGKARDMSAIANTLSITASTDGVEKWMSDVLDADQAKRFHELILQFNGTMALTEPSVARELELTAEQKSRVSTTIDRFDADQQAAFMGIAQHHGQGDMKAMRKKMDEQKREVRTSLAAILTPAQATKWDAMAGAKFKFPKGLETMF